MIFRNLLCFGLLTFAFNFKSYSMSLVSIGNKKSVVINSRFKAQILENYKGFRFAEWDDFDPQVLKNTFGDADDYSPMAIFRDYNLDGVMDAVFVLKKREGDKKLYKAISAMSQDSNLYKLGVHETWKLPATTKSLQYLYPVPKESIVFKSVTNGRSLSPRDGFMAEVVNSNYSVVYCYNGRKMGNCERYIDRFINSVIKKKK